MPNFTPSSFGQVLSNFADLIHELVLVSYVFSFLFAIILLLTAGYGFYKHAHDPVRHPLTGLFLTLLSAAGLASLGVSIATLEATVLGPGNTSSILSYQVGGDSDISKQFYDALRVVLMFIQFVGYLAVIRGLLMLRRICQADRESTDTPWRVSTHLLGGAACTNILMTLNFTCWLFAIPVSL